jgi:uncharacterized MAPEG superfamily protein
MTTELTVLTLAGLLQVIQFTLMAIPANLELGRGKTMSPRDPAKLGGTVDELLSERAGRLKRAMDNHFEGLILFTIACVVITVSGRSTTFTGTLAIIYLFARIIYIPAYAFGWVPWRSYIWFAGFLSTALMFIAALV